MQIQLQRASLAGPSDRGQHCQTGHPKAEISFPHHDHRSPQGTLFPQSIARTHDFRLHRILARDPADYQCT
jgi:hypothetical protein